MSDATKEYTKLLKKGTLVNKYRLKALQYVAETNTHYRTEILTAITNHLKIVTGKDREELTYLLNTLTGQSTQSNQTMQRPRTKEDKEDTQAEGSEEINNSFNTKEIEGTEETQETQEKEEKEIEEREEANTFWEQEPERGRRKRVSSEENKQAKVQKKENTFFPFPLEYLLFNLISKQEYLETYTYYSQFKINAIDTKIPIPELSREYLITPHLSLAIKLLYSSSTQCKICGIRIQTPAVFKTHMDIHQKRSQIEQTAGGHMYREWLIDLFEGTTERYPVKMTLNIPLHKNKGSTKPQTVPVNGQRNQKCSICKDPFEVIWSDEDECWSFKDAILLRESPTRQVCHQKCAI
ncbi:hypothetical protein NEOKW01_0864 [Nematocida sp. AWRm80]|nr:hypothetical protein NEOKW01_0864 [Nematocida sp. AWRm80]